jgi:hypothetical protein
LAVKLDKGVPLRLENQELQTLNSRTRLPSIPDTLFPSGSYPFPNRNQPIKNLRCTTLKKPSKFALSIPSGFGFSPKPSAISNLQAKRF